MKYRDKILQLREEGNSYNEIVAILGCAKSTVSFHCGQGQKEKYKQRQVKNRKTQHPYTDKTNHFIAKKINKNIIKKTCKNLSLIRDKIRNFHLINRKTKEYQEIKFTTQDVINKFGENPKCYLTGKPIDIYQPRTYHFDHIIPASKGGDNSIDNLGICTRNANQAKHDMTYEELIELCKSILDTHNKKSD